MPQHYGNKKKRSSGDPILEPGLAAATRRSQAPKKKASPRAELKSLQKQMKKMMDAMRPFAATPTRQQQKKAPARTSDPNLEPGVASATRRSQRTRKTTPKIDPLPRKKFKKMKAIEDRLVPNIGTPVTRRRVPKFPPAFETDFPYGRPVTAKTVTPRIVTPRIVTPRPTGKRTGTKKRRRR